MSASDARPVPIKNTAFRVSFPLFDADGDLVSGAATLDSELSGDAATFADATNEATEIAVSSGMYFLDLTAGEMNFDTVAIIVKTATAGAKTSPIILYPQESGDIKVDLESIGGVVQSATDLKDFADDGYDPGTNKVQGVVLVDTTTVNTDQKGLTALTTGTAQAGAATTITLAAGESATNDLYKGTRIAITGGTGIGQSRIILGYVGATKVASITPAWVTNPDATSVYEIQAANSNTGMWADTIVGNSGGGFPQMNVQEMATDSLSADALKTDAVNEIRDAILADSTSFNGADIASMAGKLPTDFIMGSSVATSKDTNIDNIETDTNEIQGKLPTNNIMGSGVLTNKDDEIDAIKAKTDTLAFTGGNVHSHTKVQDNLALTAQQKLDVNTEADGALVSAGLDHLVSAAVTPTDITDDSIIAKIASKSATADWDSFDNTTDSLEGISDGGGGGISAQGVRDAMSLASTAGTPAADSVDEHLDDILADTNEMQGKLPAGNISEFDESTDDVNLSATGLDNIILESSIATDGNVSNDTGAALSTINAKQGLSLIMASAAGVAAGGLTTTATYRPTGKPAASVRISATTDSSGNRTAQVIKVVD